MFRSLRVLALPALLALSACNNAQPTVAAVPGVLPDGGTVLVTVNGAPVTQEMLDLTLRQIPEQLRMQLEQTGQIGQLQEQLIIGQLLYKEAIAANVHTQPSTELALAMSQRNALADAMLEKIVTERTSEEAAKKWYDEHQVQFRKEQAFLRVMAVADEAKATEIKAQIDAGGDFAALAKEHSLDTSTAPNGGELGWVSKTEIAPPIAAQVFGVEKGTVVGPMVSPGGALLFKIDDVRDMAAYEDVADEVKERMKQEIVEAYIKEIRDAATVVETPAGGKTDAAPAAAPAAPAAADAGHGHSHDPDEAH